MLVAAVAHLIRLFLLLLNQFSVCKRSRQRREDGDLESGAPIDAPHNETRPLECDEFKYTNQKQASWEAVRCCFLLEATASSHQREET